MNTTIRGFAVTILSCMAWASVALAGQPATGPMDLLKAKEAELRDLLAKPKGEERTKAIKALADSLLDYHELARRSLGKKIWASRTEAQRADFTRLLRALIEKGYVGQAEKNPEYSIEWVEQELGKKGDVARVLTLASSKGSEVELEFRLMKTDRGWIVYNILVDGVSMTRNYRKSFKKIIKKHGWDELIARMERKLAGEPEGSGSKGAGR